ncbi:MAG: hypothetical protein AAFP76_11775 [Bacteroidota bacterium]
MSRVAVNIKTDDWNKIISDLREKGWKRTSKYYGFDAGIDHDFLILKRASKKITFGWSNWFEGEINCTDELFDFLKSEFNLTFEYGEPEALKLYLKS